MTFTNRGFRGTVSLDYFTDRELFEAVTLSIWLRGGTKGRFTKKSLGGDKVTASGNGSFASKTGISLGWRAARVKGLNVTGLPKEENAKKPNGIRPRKGRFAKTPGAVSC